MKANTRLFGEIDIDEEKIITLENGMIGFPDLRKFTLIFDKEKERTPSSIMWFQSMDEPEIAFPVMHPNEIKPDYAPSVSDEMLTPLGDLTEDNTYILVTLTAAADKKDTTVNLKAPLVINTDTRKGCQVTVLEHKERPGKKILATGNGRCNLTNLRLDPDTGYRGGTPGFAASVLSKVTVDETLAFFEDMGLPVRDRDGYV